MARVERENGFIVDSEVSGDSVFTITVEGIHPMDEDMMDRTLQFVMIELGIDTAWQEVEPPPVDPPVQAPVPLEGHVPPPTFVDEEFPPEEGPEIHPEKINPDYPTA
jgi:hypothetical protein